MLPPPPGAENASDACVGKWLMVVRFVVTGLSAAAGAAAMYAGLQAGGSTPGGPGWPPPPSPAHPAAAAAAAAAAAHQLANSIYAAPPPPPHPSAPAPHDLAHHMSWSVIPAAAESTTFTSILHPPILTPTST